jgi:hypothetical protein
MALAQTFVENLRATANSVKRSIVSDEVLYWNIAEIFWKRRVFSLI